MSKQMSIIKMYYGEKVSRRIQQIYDIQKFKNKDLLNINEIVPVNISEINFIDISQEVAQNFLTYIENGGNIISATIPKEFMLSLKNKMLEEEIPYMVSNNTIDSVLFFTKDVYKRDFLQAQKDVFVNTEQKPSYSFESSNIKDTINKDDYEK